MRVVPAVDGMLDGVDSIAFSLSIVELMAVDMFVRWCVQLVVKKQKPLFEVRKNDMLSPWQP